MAASVHHLRPTTALAERVLLPEDPHWALAIAQVVTDAPKMFNHTWGLWGYTGTATDGEPLSIQSTGRGGASAAIVCEELIALGARRLVRIGTCAALPGGPPPGTLLAAEAVLARDGASRALGARETVAPDASLQTDLVAAGAIRATVASTDLFYGAEAQPGAVALDLEGAAILRVAELRGVAAACLLGVARPAAGDAPGLGREELERLGVRLGEVGRAALGRPPARS